MGSVGGLIWELRGGLATLVERRLSRLPAWTLPALRFAAIRGRRIDLPLQRARFAADTQEAEVPALLTRWLTACADAAVLELSNEHWQFSARQAARRHPGLVIRCRDATTTSRGGQPAAGVAHRHRRRRGRAGLPPAANRRCGGRVSLLCWRRRERFPRRWPKRKILYALRCAARPVGLLRSSSGCGPASLGRSAAGTRRARGLHADHGRGLLLFGLRLPSAQHEVARGLLQVLWTQGQLRLREIFPTLSVPSLPAALQSREALDEAYGLFATHGEGALYLCAEVRLLYCALCCVNPGRSHRRCGAALV